MDTKLKLGVFFALFTVLSILFYNVELSYIIGAEEQPFTMFQFIGPVAGGMLSPLLGVASVLAVEVFWKLVAGTFSFEPFAVVRLFTVAAAALCFGLVKKEKLAGVLIPIVGIVMFLAHPVGMEAWGYAALWLIPIGAAFFAGNLFARSIASTFQAHVIGSIGFLYLVGLPASVWWGLIPVVLIERGIFALGISLTYVALASVVQTVGDFAKVDLRFLGVEKKYAYSPAKRVDE